MSMRIAEIKAFDNPKLLERYIKNDERILYQMAEDMMRDNSRLVALTVDTKDSFGVGLFNIDTKESLITALPKWKDSDPADTKEANYLISNIFHDLSNSNDLTLGMYDVNSIEDDIKGIVENNSAVIEKGVSVGGIEMSPILTDSDVLEFDNSLAILNTGSLFDEDLIREEVEELSLNDLENIFNDTREVVINFERLEQLEKERIADVERENNTSQSVDFDESPSAPAI
jgi:hypothetical protein